MAVGDNVGINPGSVTQIAADQVNRGEGISFAQFIKLLDGTDGSVNAAIVDAAGALKVIDAGVHTAAKNYALSLNTGSWTIVQSGGAPLAGRVTTHIQNYSDVAVEVAFTNVGALGTGTIIPAGQSIALNVGLLSIYVQPVSGTGKRVNIIELA